VTLRVYEDDALGTAFYQQHGYPWLTREEIFGRSYGREHDPYWNCQRNDVVVLSDGSKDGAIHVRYVLKSRYPSGLSDLREEVFLDAETHLATKKVSSWEEYSGTRGDPPWRYERICEFSAFNEPVVFPDDLPKSALGF